MKFLAALLIAPFVAAQGQPIPPGAAVVQVRGFLIRQNVKADTTLSPVNHAEFEVGPVDLPVNAKFDFCTVEGPAEDGSKTTACGTAPYSFALLGGSPGAYKIRITFKAAEYVILRGTSQGCIGWRRNIANTLAATVVTRLERGTSM